MCKPNMDLTQKEDKIKKAKKISHLVLRKKEQKRIREKRRERKKKKKKRTEEGRKKGEKKITCMKFVKFWYRTYRYMVWNPLFLCMGWVWKLPNSFLVGFELRRTLRLLYMCFVLVL